MRFEFVEEVEGVASFSQLGIDGCADEGREKWPVVGQPVARIQISKTGDCSRYRNRESYKKHKNQYYLDDDGCQASQTGHNGAPG